ncbi:MAG: SCP2 sterol-binding domain-containing protein [Xanthomonadales bacterium]|nr:SCP2 sterol-binding domain-containing protein [Xanthomonadales bacterium]
MARYRTPLPALFAASLETAISRLLELDANSSSRLERLDGRLLQLDLEDLGITLFFAFTTQRVRVGLDAEREADAVVSGSPAALFSLAVPDEKRKWGAPGSRVTISGDAGLARDLERLFSRLDPDWEGRLSRLLGDVWGYQVAAGLRAGAEQARETAENTGDMLGEYLVRAGGPLPQPAEIRAFSDAVDATRDAVERAEARLRALKGARQTDAEPPEEAE